MEKFRELFEARVNFGEKGDVLVIKYGNPTAFYVVKKKDLKKEFRDEKKYGDLVDETSWFFEVTSLKPKDVVTTYLSDGYIFIGL